ncbi:MAG: endonuclease/exonuclease/phosphatase family protein [Crocinitomicaceae bacterium]|nr:endonuclease/exonuclease/phosphatase family protein [Crocinitomicaceae bacterium]
MMDNQTISKFTFLFVVLLANQISFSQNPQEDKSGIRIMFYNVENLFHPSNDSLKNDDEFTPEGTRYWSYQRYQDKLNKTAKTIIALGGWEPPAVVGLCEVENIQCLKDLIYNSPLEKFGYEIVHQESKDNRGIDVALLYRPEFFQFISFHSYELIFPADHSPTRDILYVKGMVGEDTLHLFVNHWPSRYGGQMATEPKRQFAAQTLRQKYDSLMAINPNANILAMGDFNDHPDDVSMFEILRAKKDTSEMQAGDLLNLIWQYEHVKGTHNYQHEWGILDQFIASPALFSGAVKLLSPIERAQIFDAEYLLEPEKDGIGQTTNRTYIGFDYHGGFADHLPIYLDIIFK